MADTGNDTSTAPDGTQEPNASTADAQAPASTPAGDEVSVLRSRYAGQTAKVNELTKAQQAAEARAAAAEQRLRDYEAGKVEADEALKSQLQAAKDETAQARKEAAMARIEAKFPEVFAELGEDAAALTEEKLAAMEARLRGNVEEEAPTPRGQNAARSNGVPVGGSEPKAESSADILARMRTMALPPEWGGQG